MIRNTIFSFGLAIQNIRTNLFHTVLSVLGIVIGVAALVTILSFIDGLEKYAKDQIAKTTSINALMIETVAYRQVDAVRVKKDTFAVLDFAAYSAVLGGLPNISRSMLMTTGPRMLRVDTATIGAIARACTPDPRADTMLLAGRNVSLEETEQSKAVAVVNQALAKRALGHERWGELLGKTLHLNDKAISVVGVVRSDDKQSRPEMTFPISLLTPSELRESPPAAYVEATSVEHVQDLEKQLKARLEERFSGRKEDFSVRTNNFRVDQAAKGFMLFRIVMGLIVGISIVVGGIGVMNVLLISVNERITEIGIRKAVGGKRRDILRQFLAESITVSAFGSFLGLLVGILATMIIVPIVKALTDLPIQVVYTWNTFITISVIAVLVGIIFGTYPAMKASKLDPVEAIRRE